MDSAPVRIAAISLVVTVCLLALKLTLGLISDSIAVLGDAVDSGTDLAAATAALLSVRLAMQPADATHPYGHGKIEAVSAGVAATIVGLGGGLVVVQAVRRLAGDAPDIDVGVGLAAMVVSAGANLVLGVAMRREAKRVDSMALKAEATHLQTNVVQASAIIAGLLLVWATDENVFDPLTALGLAGYMGWTAWGLVQTALSDIMDEALPEEDISAIHDVLAAHREQIRGFHRLRSRRSGTTRHVDMHLSVDPSLTVVDVHEISESIERDIDKRLPGSEVVIHLEPDDGAHQGEMEAIVRERGEEEVGGRR